MQDFVQQTWYSIEGARAGLLFWYGELYAPDYLCFLLVRVPARIRKAGKEPMITFQ
jgi:hypothetical protein